jgi:DNA-binding CsgD family transcriptional regulator
MDTPMMINSILQQLLLSNEERDFLRLRMDNLTMDEISDTLQESSYKIRTRIKQKLGGRNEQRLRLWLNGTENL